jgi:hypothetical protein
MKTRQILFALLLACGACREGARPARIVHAVCDVEADCEDGLECSSGVCVAPLPTASQYRACALDIDCTGGDHCDLGACTHDCVADRDCQAGETCDLRGRCSTPATVNHAPPPVPPTPTAPVLRVDEQQLAFATFDEKKTLTIENEGDAPLAFRMLTDRDWLSAEPVTGDVPPGANVTVTVLARSAGTGTRGTVSVVSTGGAASVGVSVPCTLKGSYQGEVHVTSPSDLGSRTLAVGLEQQSSGRLVGVVDDARSPAFGFRAALAPASAVTGQAVTLEFVIPGRTGTNGNPSYPRDIRRKIVITGTITATAGISGKYTETIEGALAAPVVVSGTIELAPVDRAAVPLPAQTDEVELAPSTPPTFLACDICPAGRCPTDHVQAGRQFLEAAFKFYDSVLAEGTPDAYEPVRTCVDDSRPCYDPIALHCAQAHFSQALENGEGQRGLLDTFKGLLVWNTLRGNEHLVRAFSLGRPLEDQRTELEAATTAFAQGFLGAREGGARVWGALDPFFLDWLLTLPATQWARPQVSMLPEELLIRNNTEAAKMAAPFADLGRVVANLDLWIQALRAGVAVKHKLNATAPSQLVLEAGRSAAEVHLTLALVATLQARMQAKDRLARAVVHTDQLATKLQVIANGLNPAGYSDQFIAYTYTAALGAASNNYLKLMDDFNGRWLANAAASHAAAEKLQREFESERQALTQQLLATNQDSAKRIADLCGTSAITPTLSGCGRSGGLVFDAAQQIETAQLRLQNALTAVKNQKSLIEIEQNRAAEQVHLHQVEAVAIGQDGKKLEDLQDRETQIEAMAEAANGFIGSVASGNPTAFAGGAISAAVTVLKGEIAKERIRIETLAKARVEYNQAKELLIDSAARVKQLMLEIPVLNIDAMMAVQEIARLAGQLRSHLQDARDVLAAREVNQQLASTDPRRDPAFRQYRDRATTLAGKAFDDAQGQLFLITRALEFEIGMSFGRRADLFALTTPTELASYAADLDLAYQRFIAAVGNSQDRTMTISLRDQIYRFASALPDETTGASYTPSEIFRRLLAEPRNRDANGNVRLSFSLPLAPDALIFNRGYCTDKITGFRVSLVGASLGATQPEIVLQQRGSGYLRSCTETDAAGDYVVSEYNLENTLGARRSIIQAGLNLSGPTDLSSGGPVNTEFYGRPIAAPYELIIDRNAPANANLDLTKLDDIVLFIQHETRTVH